MTAPPVRPIPSPTPAQAEVLELLSSGMSYSEIAEVRGVTAKTVKNTVYTAKERTGAKTTTELVSCALENGWIEGNRKEEKEICRQVIDLFGADQQMDQAIEECAELVVAIRHYRRDRSGLTAIAEEIADVEIMMTQLRHVVGDDLVEREKERKFERMRGWVKHDTQSV